MVHILRILSLLRGNILQFKVPANSTILLMFAVVPSSISIAVENVTTKLLYLSSVFFFVTDTTLLMSRPTPNKEAMIVPNAKSLL